VDDPTGPRRRRRPLRGSEILAYAQMWAAAVACALFAAASAVLLVRGDAVDRGAGAAGLLFFGAGAVALLGVVPPTAGWFGARAARSRARGTEPDAVLLVRSRPVGAWSPVVAMVGGVGAGGMVLWGPADLDPAGRIAAWAGLLFLTGGGVAALVVRLAQRGPDVTLSPSGLGYRSLRRRSSTPWSSIAAIAVRRVGRTWCLDVGHTDRARTSLLPLAGTTAADARRVEWVLAAYVVEHGVVVPVGALVADPERAVAAVAGAATAEHAAFLFVALVHAADGPDRRRALTAVLAADPDRWVPVAIGIVDDHGVPLDGVVAAALDRADPDWATASAWYALLSGQDGDPGPDPDEWAEDDERGEQPTGGTRPSADREEEFDQPGLCRTAVAVTRALVSRAPGAGAAAWALTRHAEALYLADRCAEAAAVAERARSACQDLLAARGDRAGPRGASTSERLSRDLGSAELIIAMSGWRTRPPPDPEPS
jgi:hypothetical protein